MKYWFEKGVNFTCIECGRCCRGEPGVIWFTDDEANKISEFLGISAQEFRSRWTTKYMGRETIREHKNGDCFFYDPESAKCKIYKVRPAQCSLFPFWASVMESKESWDEAAQSCPGMNSGERHPTEEILSKLNATPFAEL